jgi:amino acid transporter
MNPQAAAVTENHHRKGVFQMAEKKLGMKSVVATGVGLIVATSCLLSLGQGSSAIGLTFIISMVIACVINILFALSASELNALMPNITGGLPQYTLASMGPFVTIVIMVGGYLACNTMVSAAECAMFGNTIFKIFPDAGIPAPVYCVILVAVLMLINLNGVDMFAKVQDFVAYALIISLLILGVLGTLRLGSGEVVTQPAVLSSRFTDITSLCGLAFFLFIGCEYVIPIGDNIDNPRKKIPVGMVISLLLVLTFQIFMCLGFRNYTPWNELAESTTTHILYGSLLLGRFGTYWMAIVSILAVVSSVNTVISSLSYIAAGMAKIGLLPEFFGKTNRKGAPVVGILLFGGVVLVINAAGLSTSGSLSFLILCGCAFWMISYLFTHFNVLILRKRLPHAPRKFKIPGGPVIPLVGAAGMVWMFWNISSDPAERMHIYRVCLLMTVALSVYAFFWIRRVMHRKLFHPFPVEEVMAMDNELYGLYRDPKTGRVRSQYVPLNEDGVAKPAQKGVVS